MAGHCHRAGTPALEGDGVTREDQALLVNERTFPCVWGKAHVATPGRRYSSRSPVLRGTNNWAFATCSDFCFQFFLFSSLFSENFPLYSSELLWFLQRLKKLFQAAGTGSLRPSGRLWTPALGGTSQLQLWQKLPHPILPCSLRLQPHQPGHEAGVGRGRLAGEQLSHPPSPPLGTNSG